MCIATPLRSERLCITHAPDMMWCDGNDDYSVVRGSDFLLLNDNRSDESPRRCPSPTRNISSLCLCLAEPSYSFNCTVLTVYGAVLP